MVAILIFNRLRLLRSVCPRSPSKLAAEEGFWTWSLWFPGWFNSYHMFSTAVRMTIPAKSLAFWCSPTVFLNWLQQCRSLSWSWQSKCCYSVPGERNPRDHLEPGVIFQSVTAFGFSLCCEVFFFKPAASTPHPSVPSTSSRLTSGSSPYLPTGPGLRANQEQSPGLLPT